MIEFKKPDLITVMRRRKRELEEFIENLVNKGLTEEELKEKLEKEYNIHPLIADKIKKAAKHNKPRVEKSQEPTTKEPQELVAVEEEEEKSKKKTKKKKSSDSDQPNEPEETTDAHQENLETELEGENDESIE